MTIMSRTSAWMGTAKKCQVTTQVIFYIISADAPVLLVMVAKLLPGGLSGALLLPINSPIV